MSDGSFIVYTNQEHLPTRVISNINFTDELIYNVQHNVPVVEDTFVDDCNQMIQIMANKF